MFSVYFSFHDQAEFCVYRSTFFSFFNYSHLPHGYKKKTVPFHKFFPLFFFLNSNTAASVGKGTKLNAAFSSVFVRPFSHTGTPEKKKKNLGKSRWAKSVVTYESAEICGSRCQGKICHISPNLREKIRREAEDRGRRAVEVCQG